MVGKQRLNPRHTVAWRGWSAIAAAIILNLKYRGEGVEQHGPLDLAPSVLVDQERHDVRDAAAGDVDRLRAGKGGGGGGADQKSETLVTPAAAGNDARAWRGGTRGAARRGADQRVDRDQPVGGPAPCRGDRVRCACGGGRRRRGHGSQRSSSRGTCTGACAHALHAHARADRARRGRRHYGKVSTI
eukprot:SAG22_NODE_136_length_18095_cov_19.897255_14_plen_187_part_00